MSEETENLWHQFTGLWGAESSIPRTTQPAGLAQKVYSELLGVYPGYVYNIKSWQMGVKAWPLVLRFSELGLDSALGARAVLPLMGSLLVRIEPAGEDRGYWSPTGDIFKGLPVYLFLFFESDELNLPAVYSVTPSSVAASIMPPRPGHLLLLSSQ